MIKYYKKRATVCNDKMYFSHVYPEEVKRVVLSIKSNSVGGWYSTEIFKTLY